MQWPQRIIRDGVRGAARRPRDQEADRAGGIARRSGRLVALQVECLCDWKSATLLKKTVFAGVRCGAHQRKELERLCRYITRPAIANERVKRDCSGDVVLQLKSARRDGTTHIRMSPLEFMQRLAALVPRPRLHLIRFHGVLAPNAGLRAAIVPGPAENTSVPADEHAHGAPARMSWSRLLRRVFDIDLERCVCGGKLKIIAAIEEPAVIVKILTHLGLPARASPRAPARRLPLFETA